MNSGNRQIFGGTTISYFLIAVNALYGLIATPFIISQIGDVSFGVYKTITAFASALMVVDLGLGSTVQRYIANYRANDKISSIGNFVSMSLIEAAILSILALLVIAGIYFNIDNIFSEGMTSDELQMSKKLFCVLGITIIFHVFENVMSGVLMGFGEFIASNGLRLLRVIIRIVGTFVFLYIWKSPMTLVVIDCVLVIGLLLFEIIYCNKKIQLKISYEYFDSVIFKESVVYSLLMLITSLANQVNGNLDNVVIGAIMGPNDVAVYSIALIIFGMFAQIACSISGLLLPQVSFLLKKGVHNLQGYIVQIGRIQFILIGSIFGGFIVLGKEFLMVWLGPNYLPAYYISIILMGPAILELCVNVCLTMLRALNKLKFKTIVTVAMMIFNAVLTVVGVKYFGYYMAAVATALSYLIGSVVIMNLYYRKEFGYNMFSVYQGIFSRTWICIVVSSIVTYIFVNFFSDNWIRLIVGLALYSSLIILSMSLYGLTEVEKNKVLSLFKNREISD